MKDIRSDFVEVVVFRRSGRRIDVLLLRRSDNDSLYPGIWQLVSGRRRRRETAKRAAVREVEEETGLVPIRLWSLPFVNVFHLPRSEAIQCAPTFAAEVRLQDRVRRSSEHSSAKWLSVRSAMRTVEWPSYSAMLKLVDLYIRPRKGFALHTLIDVEGR